MNTVVDSILIHADLIGRAKIGKQGRGRPEMTDVEEIFYDFVVGRGGETDTDEMEQSADLTSRLAWGVDVVDVVRSLSSRGLVRLEWVGRNSCKVTITGTHVGG